MSGGVGNESLRDSTGLRGGFSLARIIVLFACVMTVLYDDRLSLGLFQLRNEDSKSCNFPGRSLVDSQNTIER